MKTESGNVKIAGGFTVDDWNALKVKLEIGGEIDSWKQAYNDFFLMRINTRYFAPINLLMKQLGKAGEGFSIVVLQCSLIEFLESTLEGKSYKHCRPKTCNDCDRRIIPKTELNDDQYSNSINLFKKFLTKRTPFNKYITNPTQAGNFYEYVRCALLHEARTKGGWRIHAECKSAPPIDVKNKIVYRNNLQSDFEEFVRQYGENLPNCEELQRAFIRKFDSLCYK